MIGLVSLVLVAMLSAATGAAFSRRRTPASAVRSLVLGLNGANIVLGLLAVGLGMAWLASPSSAAAAGPGAQGSSGDTFASLAAALATGLAAIGAGIAVSSTGSAAIGTIAEKPESFGRALIFVGLAEGIAIYGLIVSFMVLNR
jgi:V/A-type H+-transporting ATPase subunit K